MRHIKHSGGESMREITVGSWDELLSCVFDGAWDSSIKRYRNNRVFRGSSSKDWIYSQASTAIAPITLTLKGILFVPSKIWLCRA